MRQLIYLKHTYIVPRLLDCDLTQLSLRYVGRMLTYLPTKLALAYQVAKEVHLFFVNIYFSFLTNSWFFCNT